MQRTTTPPPSMSLPSLEVELEPFVYRNGVLHAEQVSLLDIASALGTPCYVYSRAAIESAWLAIDNALAGHPHLVCYAMKANGNLAVLNLLARLGSGFDIVSGGELERVLAAGGDPSKVVFSGVCKTGAEMRRALEVGIRCFNIESGPELERLAAVAGETGRRAPVSVRVNPDVDARTHPYISTGMRRNKFGVPFEQARALYHRAAAMEFIDVCGIDCHIGSQLTSLAPQVEAMDRLLELVDALANDGVRLRHLDPGGGFGIRYRNENVPALAEIAATLLARIAGRDLELVLEPGRSIVGNAGLLLTRVEYVKEGAERRFALVDAAMNDLLRPALYDAWHDIVPVRQRSADEQTALYDIVGPVCESSDFLGRERELRIESGDLLAVRSAGAYGFVMSSNYNARPRPAEVLVDGECVHLARPRERTEDLFASERLLPA